jgi:hypothetical protein
MRVKIRRPLTFIGRQLGFADPENPTPEQLKQIKTAKKLYMANLRVSSTATIKLKKAKRMHARAAAIEAEFGGP